MSEEEIRQISKEVFQEELRNSEYTNSHVPYHTHNGTDSPLIVVQPTVQQTYAGSIGVSGSAVFLPVGWASSRSATGDYLITHNLGTTGYAVALTLITASQTTIWIAAKSSSDLEVFIKDTGGTAQNHAFDFIIVRP